MGKTYEKDLPQDYVVAKVIDAKDTKFAVIMNIFCFVIVLGVVALTYFTIRPEDILKHMFESVDQYFIFMFLLIFYIVMHELVHGLAYKLLTRHKLTFGLTWSVAYCGVPDIYTYRKTSLIALLSPFVIFNIIFFIAFLILKSDVSMIYCSVLFGLHLGGCLGDLYDTYLLLFCYKDDLTLIHDDGPKQVIYIKR